MQVQHGLIYLQICISIVAPRSWTEPWHWCHYFYIEMMEAPNFTEITSYFWWEIHIYLDDNVSISASAFEIGIPNRVLVSSFLV